MRFFATYAFAYLVVFGLIQVFALSLDITWQSYEECAPVQFIACSLPAFFTAMDDAAKPADESLLRLVFKR